LKSNKITIHQSLRILFLQPPGVGNEVQVIPVPKPAVGVVIGKGGDMINQIQNVTATRIQFKPGKTQ